MRMNWKTNDKMRELLYTISSETYTGSLELTLHFSELKELFEPPFKKVGDCIIISKKNEQELNKYFDCAMNMYQDYTAYEASNTETQINCYFENDLPMETATKIALLVIRIWSLQLKKLKPDAQFCFIMSCDPEQVEIRFHQVRESDSNWLADDLESYCDGAIGYVYI